MISLVLISGIRPLTADFCPPIRPRHEHDKERLTTIFEKQCVENRTAAALYAREFFPEK